jgi:Na+/H+ antiporter NhaD/arsenite permease-like protein
MLPLIVLGIVFVLIAFRPFGIKMWQSMLAGAVAVLLTGNITASQAFHSIKWEVIIFLFGMFLIGRALEMSGLLTKFAQRAFGNSTQASHIISTIIVGAGFLSGLLMNDTIAVIGTPVMLLLAHHHKLDPKMLLLTLCFSVTIGSVMSPIGNPQNLLIALALENPFQVFSRLILPTIVNMGVCLLILRLYYPKEFLKKTKYSLPLEETDPSLERLSLFSLGLVILGIAGSIFFSLPMYLIALFGALPVLLHSSRMHIVRTIDWETLVFFIAMFILTTSVWNVGFFQQYLGVLTEPVIYLGSIALSQLISNVPMVTLTLLELSDAQTLHYLLLAAGSTIAGNLLIIGAASNVIIIQNAERHGVIITFWEFAKIGIPLTLANAVVYWILL